MPTTGGELVTETLDYDGGRSVTVYIPSESPEAVVFCGDGQLIPPWGGDLPAGAPPTMIIGAHRLGTSSPIRRAYFVAGTREPFFLANAVRWATALRDVGSDVVTTERGGTHGDPFWREELPLMVSWAFGD